LDLYLYFFDGSLRVQLLSRWGRPSRCGRGSKNAGELFYLGLDIPIALVYSGQLIRVRERAIRARAAFLLTGVLVGAQHHHFVRPIHLLRDHWIGRTLFHFGALRFAPNFFWISPIIPWTACASTVGLTLWVTAVSKVRRIRFRRAPPKHPKQKSPFCCRALEFGFRSAKLPAASIDALRSVAYTLTLRCRLSSFLCGLT
jgi:hypothetical protein